MYSFRQVSPSPPSSPIMGHVFEEMIYRVFLDVDSNLDPDCIHVQLWTTQRERDCPEGGWHAIDMPHRGQLSPDREVYGERIILVSAEEYEFTFRAKTDCERGWRYYPNATTDPTDEVDLGRVRVFGPRCPESWAKCLQGPALTHIVGPLYLGNETSAVAAARHCFTDVLCTGEELDLPFEDNEGINFHKIHVRSGIQNPIPEEQLCEGVNWIHANWKRYRKLLVYCKFGFLRAASFVLAFVLDQNRQMTYEEALGHLSNKRPVFPHAFLKDTLERLYPREPKYEEQEAKEC